MRFLSDDLTRLTNTSDLASGFLKAFHQAHGQKALGAFGDECEAVLNADPASACIPWAFAGAARARLHDVDQWTLTSGSGAAIAEYSPNPSLIDYMTTLAAMPAVIDCRDNYYYDVVLGIRYFIERRYVEAFRHFSLASRFKDYYRVVKDDFGGGASFARSFPTIETLKKMRGSRFDRHLHLKSPVERQHNLVISIGFDKIYAEAFGKKWIESVRDMRDANIALHFHIIYDGDEDPDQIDEISAMGRESGIDLYISAESGARHGRAYFASRRFMLADEIQSHFRCGVLFADADSYIADTETFRSDRLPVMRDEKRILGFITDGPFNGYMPWRLFSATWMYCPFADHSRFLRSVGDAIEYFWDPRGHNWWIDQMALCVAYIIENDMGASGKFAQIHRVLPDLLQTSEGYKIEMVSQVRAVRRLMESGRDYWAALNELNDGRKAASAPES